MPAQFILIKLMCSLKIQILVKKIGYVSQFWSIPKVSGIGAPEGLAAAEMALMNLAGWAVSCGQRNKPEMQGDGRKVKLGGNTAGRAVSQQQRLGRCRSAS